LFTEKLQPFRDRTLEAGFEKLSSEFACRGALRELVSMKERKLRQNSQADIIDQLSGSGLEDYEEPPVCPAELRESVEAAKRVLKKIRKLWRQRFAVTFEHPDVSRIELARQLGLSQQDLDEALQAADQWSAENRRQMKSRARRQVESVLKDAGLLVLLVALVGASLGVVFWASGAQRSPSSSEVCATPPSKVAPVSESVLLSNEQEPVQDSSVDDTRARQIAFDNGESPVGPIAFDNVERPAGPIPFDNGESLAGPIAFDNLESPAGPIPFDNGEYPPVLLAFDNGEVASPSARSSLVA